jgi:UDP-GlcNAc:undecaprenyl-phosphate GlcNAc-1-phosphate transferase
VSQRASIPAFVPIILPLMVVAVPLIDMGLAFVRRLGRGQSPFKPDAHHIHHRLLAHGHSHRWAVAVLWLWTLVLSFGTVSLVFFRLRYSAIAIAFGLLAVSAITFSPGFRRAARKGIARLGLAQPPPQDDRDAEPAKERS